jgi:hypothetical protein
MPFEMRSSNPDPANKDLVVFVHGFGSDAGCWKKLLDLFNTVTARRAGRISKPLSRRPSSLGGAGYPAVASNRERRRE